MNIKAIIIDDEKKGRENLRNLLSEYCAQVEILDEASSASEALKKIKLCNPDLLFLDIEMPGGTGFDLLKGLNNPDIQVIFVTAFDKYGIQAIKACAVDYLLKPVDIFELSKAVEKAQSRIKENKGNQNVKELIANIDRNEGERKIAFSLTDKIEFIPVTHIIRLEAEGNYTHVFLTNGKKLMVCKTLKDYDDLLVGYGFLRTHQSHLVNCKRIASYIKADGGYISMDDGSSVPISRQRKETVLKRIFHE